MTEEDYIDWDTKFCENCEHVILDTRFDEEQKKEKKWICIGTIPKPHTEGNHHDHFNKIQICIQNENSPTGCTCHQWTPYEAQTASVFLASAVARILYYLQPTVEEIENFKKLGK